MSCASLEASALDGFTIKTSETPVVPSTAASEEGATTSAKLEEDAGLPELDRQRSIEEQWAREGFSFSPCAIDPQEEAGDSGRYFMETFLIQECNEEEHKAAAELHSQVLSSTLPPEYVKIHTKRIRSSHRRPEDRKRRRLLERRPSERVVEVKRKPQVTASMLVMKFRLPVQLVTEEMPERWQFDEMVEDAMANPQNYKQRKVKDASTQLNLNCTQQELGLLKSTLVETKAHQVEEVALSREERKLMAQVLSHSMHILRCHV